MPALQQHLRGVDQRQQADEHGRIGQRKQPRQADAAHGDEPEGEAGQRLRIGCNARQQQKADQRDQGHRRVVSGTMESEA